MSHTEKQEKKPVSGSSEKEAFTVVSPSEILPANSSGTIQRRQQELMDQSNRVTKGAKLQKSINESPKIMAQRKRMENTFGKTIQQKRNEEEMMEKEHSPVQKKESDTGLPDTLKTGVENLSGVSMDDVKVHYNSSQPSLLNAHAYAQGSDIHIAPGQEKHLPHEAWHVVQQKQGRVQSTLQEKGIGINDQEELEREADEMGNSAAVSGDASTEKIVQKKSAGRVVQLARINQGKLVDNKNKTQDLSTAPVKTFTGYDRTGTKKTLKIKTKGNTEVKEYKIFDFGTDETRANWISTTTLPEFYFDQHDAPEYMPVWGYATQRPGNQSGAKYGTVNIISFKTPNGSQPVDVRKDKGNKLFVERKFEVTGEWDESQMTDGYKVEYRQNIRGYFKYNNEESPATLYNGVALDPGTFNEDGNGNAPPYGHRNKNRENDVYVFNGSNVKYKATDLPGTPLNKDDTSEISLEFEGSLVVVKKDESAVDEEIIDTLITRSWKFSGKVKNRGAGNYDLTQV